MANWGAFLTYQSRHWELGSPSSSPYSPVTSHPGWHAPTVNLSSPRESLPYPQLPFPIYNSAIWVYVFSWSLGSHAVFSPLSLFLFHAPHLSLLSLVSSVWILPDASGFSLPPIYKKTFSTTPRSRHVLISLFFWCWNPGSFKETRDQWWKISQ